MGCACDKSFFFFLFLPYSKLFCFFSRKVKIIIWKMQSFSVFSSGFFSSEFFCHADFAEDADVFHRGFFSSDDTEFIRRFPAATITHGFSRMRPVRSLQIPPEIGKSPTDFTDSGLVRPLEKSTQISQMTQILLLEICFFCPTDFTDLHRFWTCSVFGKKHADFADDAVFFVWIFGEFSFRLWQE